MNTGDIDQLAEARALLVKIQESLTVYEQAPGDRTRGWCGDLGTYLRGEVGVRGTIDPEVWAELERTTGIVSTRHLPD